MERLLTAMLNFSRRVIRGPKTPRPSIVPTAQLRLNSQFRTRTNQGFPNHRVRGSKRLAAQR